MNIYRRRILVRKTYEDVYRIIQESAFFETCRIDGSAFSIRCAKRSPRGQVILIPVSGELARCDGGTCVTLKLQAGVEVLLGITVLSLGFLGMLLKCVFPALGSWAGSAITMGVGALITVFSWLRGIEVVDLLEHKLTR